VLRISVYRNTAAGEDEFAPTDTATGHQFSTDLVSGK
jgi:hypothetical protein